jgi:hypothetical protein
LSVFQRVERLAIMSLTRKVSFPKLCKLQAITSHMASQVAGPALYFVSKQHMGSLSAWNCSLQGKFKHHTSRVDWFILPWMGTPSWCVCMVSPMPYKILIQNLEHWKNGCGHTQKKRQKSRPILPRKKRGKN